MTAFSARKQGLWIVALLGGLALLIGLAWWGYHTTRPEYRMRIGREAIRREEWQTVLDLADRLAAQGFLTQAQLLRSEAMVKQGAYRDALETLNGIDDDGDFRFDIAVLTGRCLLELKQLREAQRVYTWVLTQDAGHVDALRGLAAIAYDLGQLPQAIDLLEKVAEKETDDGRPHRLIGLILKDQSQYAEAKVAYQESLRRKLPSGTSTSVQRELAEVLIRLNEYDDALATVDLVKPPLAADLAIRVEALIGMARDKEARPELDAALVSYPQDAKLLRLRGQMHLKDQELDKAASRLEQAVKLAPRDDIARYHLAIVYSGLGRTKEAAAQQEEMKAIRADLQKLTDLSREAIDKPRDPEVRQRLADIYHKIGNPEMAALWEQAARACRQANEGVLPR